MRKASLAVLASIVLVSSVAFPQAPSKAPAPKTSPPQAASAASSATGKTAGEAMKNVQVLKDVPATEWRTVMVFIDASLGVSCEHCHAEPYDSDTKKAKQTARGMMKMVHEINAANFEGRPIVTCNTCHQGSLKPKGIPGFWSKTPEEVAAYKKQRQADQAAATTQPAAAKGEPSQPLPTAEQVFTNYHRAVGGGPVRSIHFLATLVSEIQAPTTLELDVALPGKMLVHVTGTGFEVRSGVNGERGWVVTPQAKRDLSPSDIELLKENFMQLVDPAKFSQAETSGKVVGTEKILDRQYTVVESETPKRLQRLYFDTQSGLLHRAYLENRAAGFGAVPSELTYEDYRDVNGVKFPFSIRSKSTADHVHMKVSEIQTNVAVDPARFEPPPAPTPPSK